MRLVRTLQNWWAWTETVLVVILGTPVVALIYAVTAPFDPGRYAAGRAFRLVGVTALRLNSLWRFRTRGSLTDARRPYVVVANHESYADVFLISCFPWEMKWLSKDTMFKIPFMGWMMQMAGDIKLVRGNRDSAADAILQCRDRLAKKVSVMIFPEGTRQLPDTPAEQFASWLPYSAYLADEKLFVNRDSLGFMLELMPQSGADDRMAEVLISLYSTCPPATATLARPPA